MRILFVLEHYPPYIGGAETLFGLLAEQLVKKGHEVRVVTTQFRPDLPVREIRSGVSVRRINFVAVSDFTARTLVQNGVDEARVIRIYNGLDYGQFTGVEHQPKVVIPSYSEGFCFAAAEAVGMGIPVISSGLGALTETVGGQFLEMAAMTPDALAKVLRRAAEDDYDERPATRYSLEDSVGAYLKFYAGIAR